MEQTTTAKLHKTYKTRVVKKIVLVLDTGQVSNKTHVEQQWLSNYCLMTVRSIKAIEG